VHWYSYRLHESTIEIAKVSKLLPTVDQGETSKFVGKTLTEIYLNGKWLYRLGHWVYVGSLWGLEDILISRGQGVFGILFLQRNCKQKPPYSCGSKTYIQTRVYHNTF